MERGGGSLYVLVGRAARYNSPAYVGHDRWETLRALGGVQGSLGNARVGGSQSNQVQHAGAVSRIFGVCIRSRKVPYTTAKSKLYGRRPTELGFGGNARRASDMVSGLLACGRAARVLQI